MDIIEIRMDATRLNNQVEFWRKKNSRTFGSNISLVIANVPFEIKHEQVALSDVNNWLILHINGELCQCHWRRSVALDNQILKKI